MNKTDINFERLNADADERPFGIPFSPERTFEYRGAWYEDHRGLDGVHFSSPAPFRVFIGADDFDFVVDPELVKALLRHRLHNS